MSYGIAYNKHNLNSIILHCKVFVVVAWWWSF